jgi:MFS family permease
VVSQIPIGWLSDRFDRRQVIIGVAGATGLIALLCWAFSGLPYALNAMIFVFGMLSLPIYGLAMAYINDHLNPKQFVAASSSAILLNGAGAAAGPLLITFFMNIMGTGVFFPSISIVFFVLAGYGLYRITKREAVPMADQGDYIVMPVRPTPLTMAITEEGHNILQELEESERKNGTDN